MEVLSCAKVGLVKNEKSILQNVSFTLLEGQLLGIAGPSGAGKSSLLRLCNLLDSPAAGSIYYKGKDILTYNPLELRRKVGYVLQKPYLFDGTVEDNLRYTYTVGKKQADITEIKSYLAKLNLPVAVLPKSKTELSGGEQQRIAFLRSLLARPDILLLDEVSAALDEANTLLLEALLKEEAAISALSVMFVSHNVQQLQRLAHAILYLENGQPCFYEQAKDFFAKGELQHE
ncbi:MAG: ATP-binding cassette domain-containing protein [Pelosinus sp.]|nr:ATP-binding cassette domain-containing protein [Pelosinus sp.]